MRAVGFVVIWCLALGLVEGAAAEPPGPGLSRSGVSSSVASSPSKTPVNGQASADAPISGSAPQVTTGAAYATGATSAVVTGNGDPDGQATRLYARYAPASARWCSSHGVTGKSSRTRSQKLGAGHEMISELSVELEGLSAETEYCTELVAINKSGTAHGGQVRFKTSPEGTQGAAQVPRRPALPSSSQGPSSPPGRAVAPSSWPTTAIVAVAILGAAVLGGLLVVAMAKLRSRRRGSARPVAG